MYSFYLIILILILVILIISLYKRITNTKFYGGFSPADIKIPKDPTLEEDSVIHKMRSSKIQKLDTIINFINDKFYEDKPNTPSIYDFASEDFFKYMTYCCLYNIGFKEGGIFPDFASNAHEVSAYKPKNPIYYSPDIMHVPNLMYGGNLAASQFAGKMYLQGFSPEETGRILNKKFRFTPDYILDLADKVVIIEFDDYTSRHVPFHDMNDNDMHIIKRILYDDMIRSKERARPLSETLDYKIYVSDNPPNHLALNDDDKKLKKIIISKNASEQGGIFNGIFNKNELRSFINIFNSTNLAFKLKIFSFQNAIVNNYIKDASFIINNNKITQIHSMLNVVFNAGTPQQYSEPSFKITSIVTFPLNNWYENIQVSQDELLHARYCNFKGIDRAPDGNLYTVPLFLSYTFIPGPFTTDIYGIAEKYKNIGTLQIQRKIINSLLTYNITLNLKNETTIKPKSFAQYLDSTTNTWKMIPSQGMNFIGLCNIIGSVDIFINNVLIIGCDSQSQQVIPYGTIFIKDKVFPTDNQSINNDISRDMFFTNSYYDNFKDIFRIYQYTSNIKFYGAKNPDDMYDNANIIQANSRYTKPMFFVSKLRTFTNLGTLDTDRRDAIDSRYYTNYDVVPTAPNTNYKGQNISGTFIIDELLPTRKFILGINSLLYGLQISAIYKDRFIMTDPRPYHIIRVAYYKYYKDIISLNKQIIGQFVNATTRNIYLRKFRCGIKRYLKTLENVCLSTDPRSAYHLVVVDWSTDPRVMRLLKNENNNDVLEELPNSNKEKYNVTVNVSADLNITISREDMNEWFASCEVMKRELPFNIYPIANYKNLELVNKYNEMLDDEFVRMSAEESEASATGEAIGAMSSEIPIQEAENPNPIPANGVINIIGGAPEYGYIDFNTINDAQNALRNLNTMNNTFKDPNVNLTPDGVQYIFNPTNRAFKVPTYDDRFSYINHLAHVPPINTKNITLYMNDREIRDANPNIEFDRFTLSELFGAAQINQLDPRLYDSDFEMISDIEERSIISVANNIFTLNVPRPVTNTFVRGAPPAPNVQHASNAPNKRNVNWNDNVMVLNSISLSDDIINKGKAYVTSEIQRLEALMPKSLFDIAELNRLYEQESYFKEKDIESQTSKNTAQFDKLVERFKSEATEYQLNISNINTDTFKLNNRQLCLLIELSQKDISTIFKQPLSIGRIYFVADRIYRLMDRIDTLNEKAKNVYLAIEQMYHILKDSGIHRGEEEKNEEYGTYWQYRNNELAQISDKIEEIKTELNRLFDDEIEYSKSNLRRIEDSVDFLDNMRKNIPKEIQDDKDKKEYLDGIKKELEINANLANAELKRRNGLTSYIQIIDRHKKPNYLLVTHFMPALNEIEQTVKDIKKKISKIIASIPK